MECLKQVHGNPAGKELLHLVTPSQGTDSDRQKDITGTNSRENGQGSASRSNTTAALSELRVWKRAPIHSVLWKHGNATCKQAIPGYTQLQIPLLLPNFNSSILKWEIWRNWFCNSNRNILCFSWWCFPGFRLSIPIPLIPIPGFNHSQWFCLGNTGILPKKNNALEKMSPWEVIRTPWQQQTWTKMKGKLLPQSQRETSGNAHSTF